MTYLDETLAAALDLARASRWPRALSLLDAAAGSDTAAGDRARIALGAAEVALESDWFAGTDLAPSRLATADRLCDPSWDLGFLHLRHDYLTQLRPSGTLEFGPAGKDPETLAELKNRAHSLAAHAPDRTRHGWARMYHGLILDNLFAHRDEAPPHYEVALEAGDDLLTREALRHLGDHDRDRGDLAAARSRWERATYLSARTGMVAGTLSQQILLAVVSRETGDEEGARRLAVEVARWSAGIGAGGLRAQAEAFLAGLPVA